MNHTLFRMHELINGDKKEGSDSELVKMEDLESMDRIAADNSEIDIEIRLESS